jgi:hypothetical protein
MRRRLPTGRPRAARLRLVTKPYAGILQASIPIPLGPDDEARVLRNMATIARAAGVK